MRRHLKIRLFCFSLLIIILGVIAEFFPTHTSLSAVLTIVWLGGDLLFRNNNEGLERTKLNSIIKISFWIVCFGGVILLALFFSKPKFSSWAWHYVETALAGGAGRFSPEIISFVCSCFRKNKAKKCYE